MVFLQMLILAWVFLTLRICHSMKMENLILCKCWYPSLMVNIAVPHSLAWRFPTLERPGSYVFLVLVRCNIIYAVEPKLTIIVVISTALCAILLVGRLDQ